MTDLQLVCKFKFIRYSHIKTGMTQSYMAACVPIISIDKNKLVHIINIIMIIDFTILNC